MNPSRTVSHPVVVEQHPSYKRYEKLWNVLDLVLSLNPVGVLLSIPN